MTSPKARTPSSPLDVDRRAPALEEKLSKFSQNLELIAKFRATIEQEKLAFENDEEVANLQQLLEQKKKEIQLLKESVARFEEKLEEARSAFATNAEGFLKPKNTFIIDDTAGDQIRETAEGIHDPHNGNGRVGNSLV